MCEIYGIILEAPIRVAIPIYKVGIFYFKFKYNWGGFQVAIPIYKVGIFYITQNYAYLCIVAIPIYKVGIFYKIWK